MLALAASVVPISASTSTVSAQVGGADTLLAAAGLSIGPVQNCAEASLIWQNEDFVDGFSSKVSVL